MMFLSDFTIIAYTNVYVNGLEKLCYCLSTNELFGIKKKYFSLGLG